MEGKRHDCSQPNHTATCQQWVPSYHVKIGRGPWLLHTLRVAVLARREFCNYSLIFFFSFSLRASWGQATTRLGGGKPHGFLLPHSCRKPHSAMKKSHSVPLFCSCLHPGKSQGSTWGKDRPIPCILQLWEYLSIIAKAMLALSTWSRGFDLASEGLHQKQPTKRKHLLIKIYYVSELAIFFLLGYCIKSLSIFPVSYCHFDFFFTW